MWVKKSDTHKPWHKRPQFLEVCSLKKLVYWSPKPISHLWENITKTCFGLKMIENWGKKWGHDLNWNVATDKRFLEISNKVL